MPCGRHCNPSSPNCRRTIASSKAGSIEESGKANRALAPLFPIMIALTLITIIFQVRSISLMTMVFATAPLGLIGVIPTLLLFHQPFGINALVGLVALSGILMRNTLILIGQIRHNEKEGMAPFDAVIEATVQRSRPVILTALAAMLAFIPLTHSVFWGTLAYTLIGGTFGGTALTLRVLAGVVCHLVQDQTGTRRASRCRNSYRVRHGLTNQRSCSRSTHHHPILETYHETPFTFDSHDSCHDCSSC